MLTKNDATEKKLMQNFEGMILMILKYLLYRTQLTSLMPRNVRLMETRPASSEPALVKVEFSRANTIIIHKNDISFFIGFARMPTLFTEICC